MIQQNFKELKPYFLQYLYLKGIDVSINPTFCINPDHHNTRTPAMQLHEDGAVCHSCGMRIDIYDAAGLICGITSKREQYREVLEVLSHA